MTGLAYYNEFDLGAAAWLRNLIAAGLIADGVVDTRSILDVRPSDLRGFAQHHFFAGIGVWSYALRAAGWRDDRPVWTGSCPCQPFSSAGDGAGFADERHLWPAFFHLIAEHAKWCRSQKLPVPKVFGEQVASKDVNAWIDLVQADLEGVGYAVGAVAFPSAGVGAPHIRDRTYWVADSNCSKHNGGRTSSARRRTEYPIGGATGRLADAMRSRQQGPWLVGRSGDPAPCQDRGIGGINDDGRGLRLADTDGGHASAERQQRGGQQRQQSEDGDACGLADADRGQRDGISIIRRAECDGPDAGRSQGGGEPESCSDVCGPGPINGFWRDADWLGCRDGKWRPVEPSTFPLVDGAAARVGRVRPDWRTWHTPAGKEGQGHRASRLKGYGNAINAEAAQIFIECVMECLP